MQAGQMLSVIKGTDYEIGGIYNYSSGAVIKQKYQLLSASHSVDQHNNINNHCVGILLYVGQCGIWNRCLTQNISDKLSSFCSLSTVSTIILFVHSLQYTP